MPCLSPLVQVRAKDRCFSEDRKQMFLGAALLGIWFGFRQATDCSEKSKCERQADGQVRTLRSRRMLPRATLRSTRVCAMQLTSRPVRTGSRCFWERHCSAYGFFSQATDCSEKSKCERQANGQVRTLRSRRMLPRATLRSTRACAMQLTSRHSFTFLRQKRWKKKTRQTSLFFWE